MKNAIRWYIIISTIASGIIAFAIIFSAIVLPYIYPDAPAPEFLESWGGIIVGFYFGSFLTLLTKVVENENLSSDAINSEQNTNGVAGDTSGQ